MQLVWDMPCKLSAQMVLVLPIWYSQYQCFMPSTVSQYLLAGERGVGCREFEEEAPKT